MSSSHTKIIYPHRIRKLLNGKCCIWNIYRCLIKTPESLNKYKSTAVECREAMYEFHVERGHKIINSGNVESSSTRLIENSRVTSLKNYSNPERLAILRLEPLELRRLRCDLIKIFNNLTSLDPAEYFTVHQPSLSSRASSSILVKPFKRRMFYHIFSTGQLTAETLFRRY